MIHRARSFPTLGLVLIAGGCARGHGELFAPSGPPIEWPRPPDPPRVRFLGEIKGSEDLHAGKSAGQVWREVLYGPEAPAMMTRPHALAVSADGDRLAVADTDAACVHVFDLARRGYRRIDDYGGPQRVPTGVAWDGQDLWIADAKLHAVVVAAPAGPPRVVGAEVLARPAGIAFDPARGWAFVSDAGAHGVVVFDRTGRLVWRFGRQGPEPGAFNYPAQIACSADGTLAVADAMNFRVQLFSPDGALIRAFGRKGDAPGDFALPKGVAFGPDGNLWVVDAHFENVQAFTPSGELLMSLGREGHAPGEFWLPAGVCIDAKRRMWVADTYNRRVQVFELLP
ncbi:MAG: hypothetical protein HRF43_12300 [Phycisphaerae bacterium]|jgi:DNA-binding beta-propeller fold protein YncE